MLRQALFLAFVLIGTVPSSFAQLPFSHEVGVIAGPVAFQSDYGERHDLSTNAGNTGFGVGLIHYMNFSYLASCNCYAPHTWVNDHFKWRTEISYNRTNLKHFGQWVEKDPSSLGVQQLRAMRGLATVWDIGGQLEYYPFSIRDFQVTVGALAPFVSLGAHYNYFDPEASSTMGPLGLPETTFPKYLDPSEGRPHGFSSEDGNTWSVVTSIGTRYKLSPLSDLMIDLRAQYYFSNWVDGLNPNPDKYPENKANDWNIWLNVGYIYYLDFSNGY